MQIEFRLRGIDGTVEVTNERNERPELVGSGSMAKGFPFCDATVDYPARGYDAVLGWIQLVKSGDNTSHGREFEIDPLDFLGEVPHPFCWIGLGPHLFDAPSRTLDRDLDWSAHSFLCVPDGGADGMEAHALLGFSWGFRIRDGQVLLDGLALLSDADWDEHRAVLAARYPSWRFVGGFRAD